jgi:poly(A) polymerase
MAALTAVGGAGAARFVGGCVRDTLLGRDAPGLDIDIATRLTPDQVMTGLAAQRLRAEPTGLEHGTVTAIAFGRPFEITTLRQDVETDGRRAVVAFTQDWAKDAARRDFTMNALYADPDGRLHDPTGRGVADARAGRVVFVGDPDTRIGEDYLRILRYFRFLAHYGTGAQDEGALAACARHADQLDRLSAERIAKELLKLLAARDPRPAVELMAQTGVLARVALGLSNLTRLSGLIEIEEELARPPDAELRLAALGPTDPGGVLALARRLKLANALRDRLIAACSEPPIIASDMPEVELRKAVWRKGASAIRDQLLLAWAQSFPTSSALLWMRHLQLIDTWRPPAFPITGDDIMALGVAAGPHVGRVRKAFEDWWLDQDFPEDRQAALDRLRRMSM